MTVSPDSSSPWSLTNDSGVRSQPDRGKRLPDRTGVLSSGPDEVGLDNGISSIKERRSARLELEAIDNELDGKGVAVFGDQRNRSAGSIDRLLEGGGVIIVGLRSVGRREESVGESVLGD